PTPTPTPTAGKACSATYNINNQWPTGFGADVTVRNTGTTPITGWTVTWTFPSGQRITQLWSASYSSSGAGVTATNLSWNGTLAANATTSFGFNGSWSGTNAVPSPVTCTPA
ncbi:cellulose binding domain-containing protein, partial [Sphaerisporangium rubeum]